MLFLYYYQLYVFRCDNGYFGDPLQLNGKCQPCECNGNNDLTLPGSCHPLTGDCDQCTNDSGGLHCERCTTWHYGDAIEAKNCSSMCLI